MQNLFTTPEQFSTATKTAFETQISLLTQMYGKAFESVEKIIDLNLSVVKASMEESTVAARQLMSAKDPQEFLAFGAAQAQPTAQKAIAYGRHLANIAASAQAEFSKATEEQIADNSRKILALVDNVAKNAPAGSENVIALFKSAVGNANAGYEQFTKSTKQAVETMESNVATAVNQFSQAAEKTTARARK